MIGVQKTNLRGRILLLEFKKNVWNSYWCFPGGLTAMTGPGLTVLNPDP